MTSPETATFGRVPTRRDVSGVRHARQRNRNDHRPCNSSGTFIVPLDVALGMGSSITGTRIGWPLSRTDRKTGRRVHSVETEARSSLKWCPSSWYGVIAVWGYFFGSVKTDELDDEFSRSRTISDSFLIAVDFTGG